jgi:hypothetical protein
MSSRQILKNNLASALFFLDKKPHEKFRTKNPNETVSINFLHSETLSPRFIPLARRSPLASRSQTTSSRRYTMQALENDLETELQLDDWFEAPTHEAAVEMMQADAVVPFGTAMWPF